MDNQTENRAAHKAAVIAYFNGHGALTAALTEAYVEGDWDGINDGLATLNADSDAAKAKAASLRTMLLRITDGQWSVRVQKAGTAKVFMVTKAGASKVKAPSLDGILKAANGLATELDKLRAAGIDNVDALTAEIMAAVEHGTAIDATRYELESKAVRIKIAA